LTGTITTDERAGLHREKLLQVKAARHSCNGCFLYKSANPINISLSEVQSMSLIKEFMDFLYEYKVIGLAIAFIIGVAATALVKSLVDNILMPIITFFIPGGEWQTATLALGPIVISWGKFLADLIYFIIVALIVFIIAKKVLKEDKVTKK
jgi:large conductance mechanosensitive channel